MILADTSFFIALLWPSDDLHTRARAWGRRLTQPLVVTEDVVVEAVNFSPDPRYRSRVFSLVEAVTAQRGFVYVPSTSAVFTAAVNLLPQRSDKGWSFADAASFVVMREQGITAALTHDHHFEQAGFRALLREDPPAT